MKCDELKPITVTDECGSYRVYNKSEADEAIAELKDIIADLQKTNVMLADNAVILNRKLEDAKATAYAESVDAGMRERRLRRALYKACANWAHHRVFVRFNANEKAWENMERKCRAKAEEYK